MHWQHLSNHHLIACWKILPMHVTLKDGVRAMCVQKMSMWHNPSIGMEDFLLWPLILLHFDFILEHHFLILEYFPMKFSWGVYKDFLDLRNHHSGERFLYLSRYQCKKKFQPLWTNLPESRIQVNNKLTSCSFSAFVQLLVMNFVMTLSNSCVCPLIDNENKQQLL